MTGPIGNSTRRPGISYLRVSTETQLDGQGLDIQRDDVAAVAATLGIDLVGEYVDEGICGAEGLDVRLALARALDYLGEHPGTVLIIPKLDRLARDLMVQESILADAWKAGAEVLSCSETERTYCRPDSPDDPARTLIRQVLGAVAAYERSMIRLRMMRGRRRLLDQQGWAGGPEPYGWSNETEQLVLAEVTMHRQDRRTWAWISSHLNQTGQYKRNGADWTAQEIQRTHSRAAIRSGSSPEPVPTLL
jgi:DNA invertase Pin-like site-specific DNA recombinase